MAEPHESHGPKIAIAALITISVVLAVACYFLDAADVEAEARSIAAGARGLAPASAPMDPR